jgi:hypothetical protein
MPCWADFTIATRGYSFRKGQDEVAGRQDGVVHPSSTLGPNRPQTCVAIMQHADGGNIQLLLLRENRLAKLLRRTPLSAKWQFVRTA